MLKRILPAIAICCCAVVAAGTVSAALGFRQAGFHGQYIVYGGQPHPSAARPPAPGDAKIAFRITGRAAKDLFDAIGPARRELSRGEERCEANPAIRTRDLDTISCRHHPKDGYRCTFGFDLSTGLATWGKPGDAGCD